MRVKKIHLAFVALFFLSAGPVFPVTVTFTVDPTQNNVAISPYIYGSNSPITYILANGSTTTVSNTYYRSGGNRLTAYNWETNWSNAGSDYYYENDTLMGTNADGPGWTYTSFVAANKVLGADSLMTLPLAGYVSANGEPAVQVPAADFMSAPGLTDPHSNFYPITFVKGAPYSDPPNASDGVVYIDEMVNFLVKHLGSSTSGGIKFYDLDNEPGAWSSTHAEVHNYPVSYYEVASKGITMATQATAIDPGAQILGPVGYGWGDFISLSGAPDHATYDATYDNGDWVPFLNYYLAAMNQASTKAGRRLLHYLDSHVYSEGTDAAGNRVNNGDVSQDAATTRMQLPREMWDPTFTENNWISCCVPGYGPMTLIPRLQGAINQFYPGTKISFTEYDYGGGGDISGGIAEADFLGVLTQYPGMLASIWDVGAGDQYLGCAFNFYLNYDGAGTKYGDTSVSAGSNNVTEATVYAAKDSAHPNHLNVILLNKDYTANNTANVSISNLAGGQSISSIRAFRFDSAISVITASTAPAFTANTFTDTLPFRSATLYELTLSQSFSTATPTSSPTNTATATPTNSPTATATGTLSTATPTATKTPTSTATNSPTITLSPTATVVCASLFNSCDSLTANGAWNGTNATRSISTANMTQGTGDLQINVTTASNWNLQIFNLTGFTPSVWNNVAQVIMDVYVSPSLISSGSTYHQFTILADSSTLGQQPISDYPNLSAGANSVTFNISFAGAGFPSTTPLTQLYFVYNTDSTGTGSFYVDNIRLLQNCAVTPTNTPSMTSTNSPTKTTTNSPTVTPMSTSTSTQTNSATQTTTNTPTPTPAITNTATETSTTTATTTPINTPTNTPSQTPTATATNSPTGTLPPTDTATNTPTNTPTSTTTNTPTATTTSTATHSPTNTVSSTSTNSPLNTATLTATNTMTSTPTKTSTSTATNTSTNTATKTSVNTVTNTATVTSTYSKTNTPTVTPTNTPTTTATNTFTPQSTSTPTNTPTITPTYTPTLSSVIVISPPFPNPSTGSPITFNIQVPGQSTVTLDVFTLAFRKIYSQTAQVSDSYNFQWDLRDVSGAQVSNGLYYVRIHVTGNQSATKILKVLILR